MLWKKCTTTNNSNFGDYKLWSKCICFLYHFNSLPNLIVGNLCNMGLFIQQNLYTALSALAKGMSSVKKNKRGTAKWKNKYEYM